jgi:TolB-like protein
MEIVGSVTTQFTSYQFFQFPNKTNIRNTAYTELKKIATREYGKYGNIDVRNIVISGGGSGWEALNIAGSAVIAVAIAEIIVASARYEDPSTRYVDPEYHSDEISRELDSQRSFVRNTIGYPIGIPIGVFGAGNTQKITATGDVVLYNAASSSRSLDQDTQAKLRDAVAAINAELIRTLPQNATVAVLSIGSNDSALSETIIDELEFSLVRARQFTVVDRGRLDQIRRERNFQMSGEVSDDSAVSIGSMLGASIVIVGTVSTGGVDGRITVRALDTQTAQIVTMAREQF